MRVLSHVCCGPCFTAVHEILSQSGCELSAYYYNPNIYPAMEYRLRLDHLKIFCERLAIPAFFGDYATSEYFDAISGRAEKPDRCIQCYRIRLERTAKLAVRDNYDAFTTSLLVSPYQNHEEIRAAATKLSGDYDIEFLYRDFRPAYRRSIELSKSFDMYRQKYCGCFYSVEER